MNALISIVFVALCSGIFGYSNLALRKPASQSSEYPGYHAYYSNDGNKNNNDINSCSHTLGSSVPQWWAVDLGNQSFVYGVNLTNRGDCCKYFRDQIYHHSFISSYIIYFTTSMLHHVHCTKLKAMIGSWMQRLPWKLTVESWSDCTMQRNSAYQFSWGKSWPEIW